MKTSARFLAMLLAVVMIASAALSVSAFSDVTGEVEHATAINVLAQLGVIGGYEDGTFKPDQNVTRAEMAKLVYVLYTTFTDAGAGTVKFNDVKADNWAVGYISWCASKGIIGGYGDGNFGPSDNVTYDQALKMVCGALGYNEWDSAQWPTDVRMKALSTLKLGEGIPETVKGSDKLTRAQVAQIMYNALDADMNETKSEPVQLVPGVTVNMPVAKKLAIDVWKYTEVTYTVIGTETYGDKTEDDEKIVIAWEEEGKTKEEEVKLADLGLEAYVGNSDDLINLVLVGIEKGGKRLANVSVMGTVKDGVSISYTSARKYITIDGVQYDAEDFAEDAKYPIALYNVDGTKSDIEVFDNDGKVTTDFTDNILPQKQYLARTIDFNGDANIDAFVVVPKVAYKVADIKADKTVGSIAELKALNGDTKLDVKVPVADINIEVVEDDIIVAAKMAQKVYAVKVDSVETYATRLNTNDGKATLNEVGEVKFTKGTLAGVKEVSITTGDLGADNKDTYYIYNGEVILKETIAKAASEYTFAIMRDVVKSDKVLDEISKEFKETYSANILVIEDGKIVVKNVPISNADGEELIVKFPSDAKEEVTLADTTKKTVVKYNYALITSYAENEDGYYDIVIGELLDEESDYVIVNAGSAFKYNSKTTLYSLGNVNKVRLDNNSVVFYADQLKTGAAKGFTDIKFYTKANLTTKDFTALTSDISILVKDEASGRYTLLATVVEKAIEGTTETDTKSYVNDGRLILFAPVGSSIEIQDGKTYNSYIFMNNETIETADAILDTNKEYNSITNRGTKAGYLYGYNPETGVYEEVNSSADLDTIEAATVVDVLVDEGLLQFGNGNDDFIKVGSDVIIWGLADDEKNDVYTKFTFEELAEMFELVKDYNEENGDAEDLEIDILMTYYKDSNDTFKLASIIVEVFEADEEEEIVYSVNRVIFDNFLVLE